MRYAGGATAGGWYDGSHTCRGVGPGDPTASTCAPARGPRRDHQHLVADGAKAPCQGVDRDRHAREIRQVRLGGEDDPHALRAGGGEWWAILDSNQ